MQQELSGRVTRMSAHTAADFGRFVRRLGMPYGWIVLVALPLQWIYFKYHYPFPNFRGDSASYIAAAFAKVGATEWPVGYSVFLRLIHSISHSDTLFVTVQYFLLELSSLFFLLTLAYFLRPGRVVFALFFAFIVFNPLFLHLGNYIMSDALFVSLSLLWFSDLLWVLYRPSPARIITHALLLFCLFTVRYNALFYPGVAALAFLLSGLRVWMKITAIGLSVLLIGLFVLYTEHQFYKLDGQRQFAPFSGWQLANNACYMYRELDPAQTGRVARQIPERFAALDSIVRASFVAERKAGVVLNPFIKDHYIWGPGSPLDDYLKYHWKGDTVTDMFRKWASVGPLFKDYGGYLIRHYPGAYVRSFVLPNVHNFFFPLVADLGYYNQGDYAIDIREAWWFGYKRTGITHRWKDFELYSIQPYPTIIAVANALFLISVILYLGYNEWRGERKPFNRAILLAVVFWLINFGFSTAASSIELRYQVFQALLSGGFALVLIEWLVRAAFQPHPRDHIAGRTVRMSKSGGSSNSIS